MHLDITISAPLTLLLTVLVAKTLGSIVSLGRGLRGGLFFASLFLSKLIGQPSPRSSD